jgi:hypothetical protein
MSCDVMSRTPRHGLGPTSTGILELVRRYGSRVLPGWGVPHAVTLVGITEPTEISTSVPETLRHYIFYVRVVYTEERSYPENPGVPNLTSHHMTE